MTNYEKYRNLVINCVEDASICSLAHTAYGDVKCDNRTCEECRKFTAEWLYREYVEIDWAKVEADTPVIIKAKDGIMFRHFAKYYRGRVYVYPNGKTSWTNNGETEFWVAEYVKLGRDEDSKKYAK